MFGMRGFLSLLLGEETGIYYIIFLNLNLIIVFSYHIASDEAKMVQMQMGMGGSQMGFDASAAYKAERDNMLLANPTFDLQYAEYTYLGEPFPVLKTPVSKTTKMEKSSKFTRTRRTKG